MVLELVELEIITKKPISAIDKKVFGVLRNIDFFVQRKTRFFIYLSKYPKKHYELIIMNIHLNSGAPI